MHRRLFTKLWAMLLVMALLLQVPAMAAFADEVTSEDVTLTVMESEAVPESET